MDNKKPPIGYYLKKVDNLLTEGINRVHSDLGITRLEWQVLSVIHESSVSGKRLLPEMLMEFATPDEVRRAVDALSARNIVSGSEPLAFTDSGLQLYSAAREAQLEFRKRAMAGISEQAYTNLIATLEKMIANLS